MARPYSQDLRDRVDGSVGAGRSCRASAALVGGGVRCAGGGVARKLRVYCEEFWAKPTRPRRSGRCARGARLVAKVPHGRWHTLTFLAALRCDRIAAPCVIDGPINGTSF